MPITAHLRPDVPSLLDERAQRLLSSATDAQSTVSIWVAGLDGDAAYAREPETVHYAASTMKVPLAVAAFRRYERGELDLDALTEVHDTFSSASDGSPFTMSREDDQDDDTWDALDTPLALRTLVERSLSLSGNLATNLLLEHVGAGAVADVLADAGCSADTVITRGIEDLAAAEAGLNNLVTAADLGLVLRGIADRTLAGDASCAEIEAILSRQRWREGIPAGLPETTYVANKTGQVDGIAHDLALVRPTDRPAYLLAVLTSVPVPEPDAQAFIADVSRLVWQGWAL